MMTQRHDGVRQTVKRMLSGVISRRRVQVLREYLRLVPRGLEGLADAMAEDLRRLGGRR